MSKEYKDTVITKLPNKAFSIYKDAKKQEYFLVEIQFDGPSGSVGSIKRTSIGPSKHEAVDQLKIAIADSGLLDDEK